MVKGTCVDARQIHLTCGTIARYKRRALDAIKLCGGCFAGLAFVFSLWRPATDLRNRRPRLRAPEGGFSVLIEREHRCVPPW